MAFIRATAADPNGNISFEDEALTCDAYAMAVATHRNDGKVIVQVDHLRQEHTRAESVGSAGRARAESPGTRRAADCGRHGDYLSGYQDENGPQDHCG